MIQPEINILAIIVASLIPNIIGAIYYGPIFGKPWLDSLGLTKEDMAAQNKVVLYGGSLLLSFITAFFINILIQMLHKDVSEAGELVIASHNTFAHGAMHGFFLCLFLIVPIITSLGLFQKAKPKNILLNAGFWLICFALMAGIVDVWK